MILLTGISSLRVYLGSTVNTNQFPIVSTYIDSNPSTFTPQAVETQTNNSNPVDVVQAPVSGLVRQLKYLSILNTDTNTNDVYIEYHTPTSNRLVFKQALTSNQKVEYMDGQGFTVIPGAFINVTGDAVTGVPFITHGTTSLLGNYRSIAGLSGIITTTGATNGSNLYVSIEDSFYKNVTGHTGDLSRHLTGLNVSSPLIDQTITYDGTNWVNSYGHTVVYATNAEANTLNIGEIVYLYGAQGDRASVKRASNTGEATSSKTVGMVSQAILASQAGPIVTNGYVSKLDLGAYSPGDVLWLDSASGAFTKVKPDTPYHLVFIGVVARANAGNGIAFIRTQNGYELDELHDVLINRNNGPYSGNALIYNGSYWVNTGLTTGYISGFHEAVQDIIASHLYPTSGLAVVYEDSTDKIVISGQRASTTSLGLASFDSSNFNVASGNVTISAIPTGIITNLPDAVKDTIGNSGFFIYRGGLTGNWDQSSKTLLLNLASGAGGASDLNSLSDVVLDTSLTGHVLAYNGTNWVNSDILTGNIVSLPNAIKDTIGNSGYFNYFSGITGRWNQTTHTLSLSGVNATTTTPGVARFNSSFFSVTNGYVAITAIPTGLTGQFSKINISEGAFATSNDAQSSRFVLRQTTSSNDLTEIYLDGLTRRAILPNDTTWHANIKVTARTDTAGNKFAGFERRCLITRGTTAASTQMIGSPQIIGTDIGTNYGSPPNGWDVYLSADTTNGALKIEVMGEFSTTIRWVAEVSLTEVSFPSVV